MYYVVLKEGDGKSSGNVSVADSNNDVPMLWHRRLGHRNDLRNGISKGVLKGVIINISKRQRLSRM